MIASTSFDERQSFGPHDLRMTKKPLNKERGDRFRYLRERVLGIASQEQFAKELGVERGAVGNWELGGGVKTENLTKIAERYNISMSWLAWGEGDPPSADSVDRSSISLTSTNPDLRPSTAIPIRGEVRAGAWMEVDGNPDIIEYLPMHPDPAWSRVPQFALKVVGTSMNKVAPPGSYVIVASWPELGTDIQENDLVVVRRERAMTYEVTLKRARRGEKGWELWPESTDPRWQEPIRLWDGDPDVDVTVIGRVIGKYERLS